MHDTLLKLHFAFALCMYSGYIGSQNIRLCKTTDLFQGNWCFCLQRNFSFVPVYTPGKRYVLADQGSRQEPLATDGTLDPELVGSTSLRFFSFPSSGPLYFEPHFEIIFFSPCSDPKGSPRGCLGSFFRLEAFPADICFSASCFYANGLLEVLAASRVQWFY